MKAGYHHTIAWLQAHMLACPVKRMLHIDCPGCGMQRSVLAILRGDVLLGWHIYPPGIFILSTILFLLLHMQFQLKNGAFILKFLYLVSVTAIVINYCYKIYAKQVF